MKTRYRFLIFLILIFLTNTKLFATAQASDILILDNEKKPLNTNPLESMFDKYPKLKEKFNTILTEHNAVISTACWRGYIAKFKIINSALYIVDITIEVQTSPLVSNQHFQTDDISIFLELFETENPILCNFFTGMLIVPQGKMINYVHGGYLSEYEKYILIKISEGKLTNKGEYSLQDYRKKKDEAFEVFYKSDMYDDCWKRIEKSFDKSISEESKMRIMKGMESNYLFDFYKF